MLHEGYTLKSIKIYTGKKAKGLFINDATQFSTFSKPPFVTFLRLKPYVQKDEPPSPSSRGVIQRMIPKATQKTLFFFFSDEFVKGCLEDSDLIRLLNAGGDGGEEENAD